MLPPAVQRLLDRFFAADGGLEPEARRACAARAADHADGTAGLPPAPVPAPLGAWIDQVAAAATTCTDEDVARLRVAGLDEAAIYDASVAAALGAATARLERALALVRGSAS